MPALQQLHPAVCSCSIAFLVLLPVSPSIPLSVPLSLSPSLPPSVPPSLRPSRSEGHCSHEPLPAGTHNLPRGVPVFMNENTSVLLWPWPSTTAFRARLQECSERSISAMTDFISAATASAGPPSPTTTRRRRPRRWPRPCKLVALRLQKTLARLGRCTCRCSAPQC